MHQAPQGSVPPEQLDLAIDAFIWGFPRMLYAKYRRDLDKAGAPSNRFFVMDRMATPDHGGVNVDTLYGVAWFDLRSGPVVLSLPDAGDRYYSVVLTDVYANNFAYLGRRTTGTGAQRVLIAGPGWEGCVPEGLRLVRSASNGVFGFLRTLIDDEADLPAANAFNARIGTGALAHYPDGMVGAQLMDDLVAYFPHAHCHLDRLGASYFDCLGDALAADPPTRPEDRAALKRFSAIGIGPGCHPTRQGCTSEALFAEATKRGNERIFSVATHSAFNGWSANWGADAHGPDPLFKAAVNRFGIGALDAEECLYLLPAATSLPPGTPVPSWSSYGPDGEPLHGSHRYRLRMPPGLLPPVDAFWSLTMYDERLFLVRNPIQRYAIGDRTRGLVYAEDGSLELLIQHQPPERGQANWLPAPQGAFCLFFRAYQPRPEFLDGRYRLPPLEKLA